MPNHSEKIDKAGVLQIAGIICEFNPLHYGHQYLLRKASEAGAVVCILSGSFVQRGEPAILDKWARTKLALSAGANLVIELPFPFACATAERFASASISLLNALNLPGKLVFGSEVGEIQPLQTIAETLLSAKFSEQLNIYLTEKQRSFADARASAIKTCIDPAFYDLLDKPNNILAIEYIKALLQTNSPLKPYTVARIGAPHDSIIKDAPFSRFESAMMIRKKLISGADASSALPKETRDCIDQLRRCGHFPANINKLETAILAKLRSMQRGEFARLPDISEGLENRLYAAAQQANTLEAYYQLAKTKRYSLARLRRLTMYAFLDHMQPAPEKPEYLRVLGMDQVGARILSCANPTLPICCRARDFDRLPQTGRHMFEQEALSTDLYALALPNAWSCKRDYTEKFIRIS